MGGAEINIISIVGTLIQLHTKTVSLYSLHDYYMHTTKGTSTLWERCIEGYCTQMYTDVHTCTQMYTDVHRCTQMYTDVHTCTHMYTHVHRCTHMYTHVHTCTQMYTHVHRCTHMYTDVHTCTHMYCSLIHIKFH